MVCSRHHLIELIVSFQKIIKLTRYWGRTELKLWPFKDVLFDAGYLVF